VNEAKPEQYTSPRVRPDRFGWQPGDQLVWYDDEGEVVSEEEFRRLLSKRREERDGKTETSDHAQQRGLE
jgi:hypothetical protein